MPESGYYPFTNNPSEGPTAIFPTHAYQILSSCIHLIGASLLSYCLARRVGDERFTKHALTSISWAKLCLMLIFVDSWVFITLSGILISGVGLSYSRIVCSLAIYTCIFFYATSKAFVYLFLAERVWIVWNAGQPRSRYHSPVYRACAVVVLGFLAVVVLMLIGRIAFIRDDGSCIIGLKDFATIPLLSYDLFVNLFLTSLFIWPLFRQHMVNPRLRRVAWRTLSAALVALLTSAVNLVIIALVHGKELGWVCLGSCSTDVTVNALVLYWVTRGSDRDCSERHPASLRMPLSVRGTIVVTKTSSAVTSPPHPQRRDRSSSHGMSEQRSHNSMVHSVDTDIFDSSKSGYIHEDETPINEDVVNWHHQCADDQGCCALGHDAPSTDIK